jgi:hypothetical protein
MAEAPTEFSAELEALLEEDKAFPSFKVAVSVVVTAGVLCLNMARGSHEVGFNPLGIECGSSAYWFLSLAVIPYCGVAYYVMKNHVVANYMARIAAEWEFHEGDVEWDEDRVLKYPIYGVFSGIIAGMFGIGGGMINGPLMVELGFLPEVAVATGATTLLFTAATSSIMYVQLDLLNYEYALPLFVIGFVGTAVGQVGFNKVMDMYKRDSLIIFVIAFVVFASAMLMVIEFMYIFTTSMKQDASGFASLCEQVPTLEARMPLDHTVTVAAFMFVVMATIMGGMRYAFRKTL